MITESVLIRFTLLATATLRRARARETTNGIEDVVDAVGNRVAALVLGNAIAKVEEIKANGGTDAGTLGIATTKFVAVLATLRRAGVWIAGWFTTRQGRLAAVC